MQAMRWAFKALFALAMGIILSIGCGEDSSNQTASLNDDVPDEVVMNFVTEETDSGRASWRLTALRANKFHSRKVIIMDEPTIEFFDEAGDLEMTLTSDFGEYFEESRDMLAYGNVVAVSVDSVVLETDTLRHFNAEDKIVSDSAVKVTRQHSVSTGTGLVYDLKTNSFGITGMKAMIIDDEVPDTGKKKRIP